MPQTKFQKCIKSGEIHIKNLGESELYFISEKLASEILKILHIDYGHVGIRKTWLIFRENYISNHDLNLTKKIVSRCEICQVYKNKIFVNNNVPKNVNATERLQTISIDFIGEFITTDRDKRYIFIIIDLFSKYVKLYATKSTKVNEIKKTVETLF